MVAHHRGMRVPLMALLLLQLGAPVSMLYAISLVLSPSRQLRSAACALGRGATVTWARVLLLLRFIPRVAGEYVFADRAALLTARDSWCASPTTAAQTYGPIGEWDVVAVTDVSWLFCAISASLAATQDCDADCFAGYYADCNADCLTFDEDLSGWNVGKVTSMQGALPTRHPRPSTCPCACLLLMRRPSELRARCDCVACAQPCSIPLPPSTAMSAIGMSAR